ncbi:MAG: hypothetical protein DRG59_11130 [Deltaproteobacteria bacterium]|nr:MAG: hypothetical protein DRG59_11130 [Deltaproteobacteria bacterium]
MKYKYIVYVDDNFHFQDETERYRVGEFDSCDEAITVCKKIVDEYFERLEKGKSSFKELWDGYMLYGEDPFISTSDPECKFSAWAYAKERCMEFAKQE